MTYAAFRNAMAEVNDLLCTVNLMSWDSRTVMPYGGVAARGQQMATVTSLARDMATGDAMARALDGARAELTADDSRHLELAQAEAAIATLSRIPAALIREMAALKTTAHAAWVDARQANDFATYAPLLTRMLDMQRQVSQAIGGGAHPYDPLLATFEPDMTLARLRPIYAQLKDALVPLIARATAAPPPRTDFLARSYPVPAQKAFALSIAERMGYDMSRGRMDDTVHPFEISFTRDDDRITSRFRETWLPGGMFALWHEAGHGMYEQGVSPDHNRSIFTTDLVNLYAVGGASFGMHESQSRLWENRVGRSRQFWALHFPELQSHFPDQLADVTATEFWRSVNQVRPSLIRVEADELTYDLHIILRSEIEADLMSGAVQVADLPAVWATRMRDFLGLEVPDDTSGVLQDVHWSQGYVGSFPTYTLGNIMGSQLFDKAQAEPGIAEGLAQGHYAPLKDWLTDNVYQHGRRFTPGQVLERVTGGGLDPAPYLADLTAKVDAIFA
ncbi:MAG: carboxypeptidase M32 [Candidatus Saccharibacteria bacterium]|nr:carboxypeptidase M32 [Pseudorhodobacter sp.]